jgi:hypothetical protein
LFFDGYKDLPLLAAPDRSLLQVMVVRGINLTAGKCRLLTPVGEKIDTTQGEHLIANLQTAGAWYFFLRTGGKWKQL